MDEGLIDPTGELLAVWRKWLANSGCDDRGWHPDPTIWGSVTVTERNSLIDAELLGCMLVPALYIEKLSLRRPANLNAEVKAVLSPGRRQHDSTDFSAIGLLVERIANFLERYQVEDGKAAEPFDFTADSYIDAVDGKDESHQSFPPVVDAYTFSISVCLLTKLLLQQWEEAAGGLRAVEDRLNQHVTDQTAKVVDLTSIRAMADARLLAAMKGLERCFIAVDLNAAWEGVGREWEESEILVGLRERLRRQFPELRGEGSPFEIGFSWGQVAQQGQTEGWFAERVPYLYYTLSALEGVVDLMSPSARAVLTPEQSVVASTLGTYYDWCIDYWRTIAQGPGASPRTRAVEDVPWQISDSSSSLYYTLYLARLVAEGATSEQEELLDRLVRVVEELGHRSRLTRAATKPEIGHHDRVLSLARRLAIDGKTEEASQLLRGEEEPFEAQLQKLRLVEENTEYDDPALLIHAQGLQIPLRYDADRVGNTKVWTGVYTIRDFTPQYMKLAARVHQRVPDKRSRERMRIAIDGAWAQLIVSRDGDSKNGYAWGNVDRLIGREIPLPEATPTHYVRSWRYTQRVVEALMAVDESEKARRPAVPEVEAVLNGVLEEVRWQISGIDDAVAANTLRQRLAELEASVTTLGGRSAGRAEALAMALDLASDVGRHQG